MNRVIRATLRTTVLIGLALSLTGCSYNKFTTQEEAIKA
jgi:hypothetical protein